MRVRSLGRTTLLWVFGLAVTVFLVSMWGRSLISDTETLAGSVAPLSTATPVLDLFTSWVSEQMADAGVDPAVVGGAVDDVLQEPEVVSALDRLLVEVVLAAGIPGAGASTVDVAAVLQPAAPSIARSISQSTEGQVSTEQVSRLIDGLEPLVVRASGSTPVVGSSSPIAGRLGTATLLALMTMLVTGWVTVTSSEDRLVAIKGLLTRVSLGALSFAVMLRIGSWVLSPKGGRAPVSQTMSSLFQSKWMVPAMVAGVAGAGVLVVWVLKRRRKSGNPELSGAQPLELDAVAH